MYELVERLANTNIIELKWVYTPKFNSNGSLVDKKAKIII